MEAIVRGASELFEAAAKPATVQGPRHVGDPAGTNLLRVEFHCSTMFSPSACVVASTSEASWIRPATPASPVAPVVPFGTVIVKIWVGEEPVRVADADDPVDPTAPTPAKMF